MTVSRIQAFGLLWLGLALAYLGASALGHRAAALSVLGLMVGTGIAASGRRFIGLGAGMVLAAAGWHYAEPLRTLVSCAARRLRSWPGSSADAARRIEPLITRIARCSILTSADMARHARWLTLASTACSVALFGVALGLAPSSRSGVVAMGAGAAIRAGRALPRRVRVSPHSFTHSLPARSRCSCRTCSP